MNPIAGFALETVRVEQRHEELEVLVLTSVGGGSHQQKVARHRAQRLAQPVPLGLLHLITEVVGGHPVGFIP